MPSQWYYSKGGKKLGPFGTAQLKKLVSDGELSPSDLIWKEGMTDWKPAVSLKGLFPRKAERAGADGGGGVRPVWLEKAEALADRVGRVTSDVVDPDTAGGASRITDDQQPAIFLQSEFFGGRTRMGASVAALDTLGGAIGSAVFSWFYLLAFLQSLSSAWEFLPFSRTEFVRITLEQKLIWRRVSPAVVAWLLVLMSTGILAVVVTIFAAGITSHLSNALGGFAFLLVPMIILAGYVVANLLAWKMLTSLCDDELHRSQIVLEYGFPQKYRLLSGLSDAPVKSQIDGVLKLCEAVSRTQFGQWDQFSHHGGAGGLLETVA